MTARWDILIFIILFVKGCTSFPEQGIFELDFDKEHNAGYIVKTMFNKTDISLSIKCDTSTEVQLEIRWLLYWSKCLENLLSDSSAQQIEKQMFQFSGYDNKTRKAYASDWERINCTDGSIHMLEDHSNYIPVEYDDDFLDYDYYDDYDDFSSSVSVTPPTTPKAAAKFSGQQVQQTPEQKTQQSQPPTGETADKQQTPTQQGEISRKKRATKGEKAKGSTKKANKMKLNEEVDKHVVASTNHDGPHMFAINIQPIDVQKDTKYKVAVTIDTKGPRGYLSAVDWPLLPFYGVMSLLYVFYGVAWLVMMFLNWRDLLRVQFWIGGVIFIGMLEKAVFFGEYETVNKTGVSLYGALILAEMVSALKRSLARVLVVIVSLGFGIVKPRLGPILHKVVALGTIYFVLGSIEGICRVVKDRNAREAIIATIPLAVLDAAICWWVFTSLVQVMRTLRLRRNVVKLSLYRHFTNTLIFAVLSSLVYMVWSIKEHRIVECHTNWREIWVDDAFWHILFCIILGVIIVLWRPSANNQRFAFSPLLETGGDEEAPEDEEKLITDAYDGMKKRSEKGFVRPYRDDDETDKDLKWIDENIPTSVADGALPSLLDSDEEVVTTKYEMSKME